MDSVKIEFFCVIVMLFLAMIANALNFIANVYYKNHNFPMYRLALFVIAIPLIITVLAFLFIIWRY